ncbi:MAG: YlxR family protein [Lachnospiraceae bacterium]|nr:YlxR family protein [Lachnospiraceae bacterium]
MAKQIPLRQCIGCKERKTKPELVRIIRTPENEICLDKTGKKNGRGAYICPNIQCFNKARKSNAFSRMLNVDIPEEIYDAISEELM